VARTLWTDTFEFSAAGRQSYFPKCLKEDFRCRKVLVTIVVVAFVVVIIKTLRLVVVL